MKPETDSIDRAVTDFLHGQLDGQCSKSMRAFAQRGGAFAPAGPRRRWRPWRGAMSGAIAAGGAIAAMILLALALRGLSASGPRPVAGPIILGQPIAARQTRPLPPPQDAPPARDSPIEVVSTRYIDEGVILTDGHTPMRKYEVQRLHCVSWFDPRRQTEVRIVCPQQQIVFVPVDAF